MLEIDFGARRIGSALRRDRGGFDGDILRRHARIGQRRGNRLCPVERERKPSDGRILAGRFAETDDPDGSALNIVLLDDFADGVTQPAREIGRARREADIRDPIGSAGTSRRSRRRRVPRSGRLLLGRACCRGRGGTRDPVRIGRRYLRRRRCRRRVLALRQIGNRRALQGRFGGRRLAAARRLFLPRGAAGIAGADGSAGGGTALAVTVGSGGAGDADSDSGAEAPAREFAGAFDASGAFRAAGAGGGTVLATSPARRLSALYCALLRSATRLFSSLSRSTPLSCVSGAD